MATGCAANVTEAENAAVCEVFHKYFDRLVSAMTSPTAVAAALYSKYLISFTDKNIPSIQGIGVDEKASRLLTAVQTTIRAAPNATEAVRKFCSAVKDQPAMRHVADRIIEELDSMAAPPTSTRSVAVDGDETTDESIARISARDNATIAAGEKSMAGGKGSIVVAGNYSVNHHNYLPGQSQGASAAAPPITTPSQPLGGSAANTIPLGGSAADLGQPKFPLDDEYDEPLALPQGAHEEIKKVEDFAKNEVRIVIQSCNDAEYRAALEMLKPPFKDFNAPVKYSDTELDIIVGIFAGQNTAIVQTAQGVECIEQLKRAFKTFPNARLLLGLGICYGIKDNFAKSDLQFADVLVGSEIGVSKTPKAQSGGLNPRETRVEYVQKLVFNIFCKNSKWDGITVCEVPEQRTAKVYVGRLCSASILMNDPDRMEKIKEPKREYLGGEMEGWAQFEIPAQSIIIKGISDFADGKKNDKWQLTAAKAAVSYAHYKLEKYGNIKYEQLKTPSFEL